MKKITLFAAVLVVASFASCKKTYTCVCNGYEVQSGSKLKKKDAKTWCETNTGGECHLK